MKKSVFKNRINQLFNNEKAAAIAAKSGSNDEVRSTPLAKGDILTINVSDTTTIEDLCSANVYNNNNYGMVYFEDGIQLAIGKLCRRANGLRLHGVTKWEMFQDFVGRAIANGGTYSVKIKDIREAIFDNGSVSKYYVFEVVSGNIPALEDDTENESTEAETKSEAKKAKN